MSDESPPSGERTPEYDRTARLSVQDEAIEQPVDERIFGQFIEHLQGAIYPGVYADYIRNGSFEVWNRSDDPHMAGLVFPTVPDHADVAYPWEPIAETGQIGFAQRAGGVHGRGPEPALDDGEDVPVDFRPDPVGVESPRYQRLSVDGIGGVQQRVALPDFRTHTFDVAVSVRGADLSGDCVVRLDDPDGDVLRRRRVPVTEDWERREIELTLDRESTVRYRDSPFGEYALSFVIEGAGTVDLDRVTLMPSDAVEGKFNPTTIERLREYGVESIRWPGGNFASQYRWRDGVGPVEDRPVTPIVNWGGLEPNYLGTNEWLRFCELADVEPYITVGYWSEIGPEEAAAWVEYCNGSTDTEMGALRAEHGHPEPWDVTDWAVGNEVWGFWQVGGTDVESYADGFEEYAGAMMDVDPTIDVDACGIDPWFCTVHDGSQTAARDGEPPVWNRTLFRRLGDRLSGIDVHRYTRGVQGDDDQRRSDALEQHDLIPSEYNQALANHPSVFSRLLGDLKEGAEANGVSDLDITVGEWGFYPDVNEGWPTAEPGTMAHAVYAAKKFQAFIRHGVRAAHWTDYTLFSYPSPRGSHAPHPGLHVQKLLADQLALGDSTWQHLPIHVDGPTFDYPPLGRWSMEMDDVPFVDAVGLVAAESHHRESTSSTETGRPQPAIRRDVLVFLTNGHLTADQRVELDVGSPPYTGDSDATPAGELTILVGGDGDPFTDLPAGDVGIERQQAAVTPDGDGTMTFDLPAASVATLRFPRI